MADIVLLKLIDSMSDDMGQADQKAVENAYGDGAKRAIQEAWDDHHLDRKCSIGSLKLSSSGRQLARR